MFQNVFLVDGPIIESQHDLDSLELNFIISVDEQIRDLGTNWLVKSTVTFTVDAKTLSSLVKLICMHYLDCLMSISFSRCSLLFDSEQKVCVLFVLR